MEFSVETIAAFLDGEVVGDKSVIVSNIAKIEEGCKGDLSFLSNMKYEQYIYTTNASAVIVDKTFEPKESLTTTLIKVKSAYESLSMLLKMYVESQPRKKGISDRSSISSSASVGEGCYVGAFAVIEQDVKIGKNTLIYPNSYVGDSVVIGDNVTIYSGVNIYQGCVIGNNVIIHSGAVIGADGFGFAPNEKGVFNKIYQIGNVIIEDDVEIGANTTIDRATMGSTIIKKGVKLDNLIQIGHNVVVGENTVAAAQVGVAGSTKIGRNCMFGGQVGVVGHLSIADFTQIGSQSGISGSVKKSGLQMLGSPAMEAKAMARIYAVQRSLPEMSKTLSDLRKIVNAKETK